jgi:hypothetical protein
VTVSCGIFTHVVGCPKRVGHPGVDGRQSKRISPRLGLGLAFGSSHPLSEAIIWALMKEMKFNISAYQLSSWKCEVSISYSQDISRLTQGELVQFY